ncbi:MAG: tetratricopeptide repeat protein [Bacteroidota bacterium]|nr:tetratricopeptide repeat protein [Bacteroidota bacterium]
MKNNNYIFILLVCFLSFSIKGYSNDLLQKAEKAYDSKNYKEAISNYEKLVSDGYRSYQLYFNLGNAYYRNNELGKAIYYYELARKVDPNDEDVRINLGIASAKTIDKIDSKENFFISAVKTNLLSSFTTNAWAWLSIGSIALASILFFIFVNSSILIVKRISFLLSCVLLLAFVLTYFLGYSALQSKVENKFAIITSKEVKIMNEPTASASSKFSLHEGTKIRVVENNGNWLLIKLDNGNEGWLKVSDVGII